jgi:hypothetical protein
VEIMDKVKMFFLLLFLEDDYEPATHESVAKDVLIKGGFCLFILTIILIFS